MRNVCRCSWLVPALWTPHVPHMWTWTHSSIIIVYTCDQRCSWIFFYKLHSFSYYVSYYDISQIYFLFSLRYRVEINFVYTHLHSDSENFAKYLISIPELPWIILLKICCLWGWRDDSEVRSLNWYCRRPGFGSSIYMVAYHLCNSSSKCFNALFWLLKAVCTHAPGKTLRHINKNKCNLFLKRKICWFYVHLFPDNCFLQVTSGSGILDWLFSIGGILKLGTTWSPAWRWHAYSNSFALCMDFRISFSVCR